MSAARAALDRRAAALALAALFGGAGLQRVLAPARAAHPQGDDPFTLGIASGLPRPGALVLWTRLAPRPHEPGGGLPPQPIEVQWEIAEDERFSRGLRRGVALARPEHAHSVHVELEGLRPAATHFYRFRVGAATSRVGRTRTAPAPDAAPAALRLALASCQHYEQGWFAAQRDIAAHELDFVLFVGDYLYESTNPRFRLRRHEADPPRTLDQYRARHATYKLDADLQAAHAAHPWVLTWDDHEVENDYAGTHGSRRPAGSFLQRRAAAYKAYFEHLPVSPAIAPREGAMPIHGRLAWGRLAELWTLDARQHRSPQACPARDDGRIGGRLLRDCAGLDDPARTVFGDAQERWLAAGLAASRAPWKLVAQASQLAPSPVDTPLGRRIYSDSWDGYPAARRRLHEALAGAAPANLLCLGGDVHRNVAADLRRDPDDPRSPVFASEFVVTSLTTRGVGAAGEALLRRSNPDLHHVRSDERGWALVEVKQNGASCTFRSTGFPVLADARLAPQARFVVEAGRPGVQAA